MAEKNRMEHLTPRIGVRKLEYSPQRDRTQKYEIKGWNTDPENKGMNSQLQQQGDRTPSHENKAMELGILRRRGWNLEFQEGDETHNLEDKGIELSIQERR